MPALPVTENARQEILTLLGYILGRPVALHEAPSRSTEPDWDSLKHIELMFLLEDHFGTRFSAEEMSRMEDIPGILRVLDQKGAA